MKIIAITLIVLLSLNLSAKEQCADIINQNEAVNLENSRSQDSVGWCYAYALADMLSYKFNRRISAVSLNDTRNSIKVEVEKIDGPKGSTFDGALKNYLANNQGFCLEEDLPSTDFKFCHYDTMGHFLKYLYELTSKDSPNVENLNCLEENIKKVFPLSDFGDVLITRNQVGQNKMVEELYKKQCVNNIEKKYRPRLVEETTSFGFDNMTKELDKVLENGKIAGVSYNYSKMNKESKDGWHASVIVGRRTNPDSGECEYLIRNSYGKQCDLNEGDGVFCHENCSGDYCRRSGHFWVSKRRMKGFVDRIVYLK